MNIAKPDHVFKWKIIILSVVYFYALGQFTSMRKA